MFSSNSNSSETHDLNEERSLFLICDQIEQSYMQYQHEREMNQNIVQWNSSTGSFNYTNNQNNNYSNYMESSSLSGTQSFQPSFSMPQLDPLVNNNTYSSNTDILMSTQSSAMCVDDQEKKNEQYDAHMQSPIYTQEMRDVQYPNNFSYSTGASELLNISGIDGNSDSTSEITYRWTQ